MDRVEKRQNAPSRQTGRVMPKTNPTVLPGHVNLYLTPAYRPDDDTRHAGRVEPPFQFRRQVLGVEVTLRRAVRVDLIKQPCAPYLFDGRRPAPDVPGVPAGTSADHEEKNDEEDLSGSGVHDGELPGKERGAAV
jgi:hypothetical protein